MKSPVPPFIDGVRELTLSAREALAKEVYDIDALHGQIIAAAGQGCSRAVIRPPRPVDLRATDAARMAEKHLTDSGFKVFWEAYVVETEGQRLTALELQIEWP